MIRLDLNTAREALGTLLNSAELDFVPCSDLFASTWKHFVSQRRTKLSFVDCALAFAATKLADGNLATFDAELRKDAKLQILPA